MAGSTHRLSGFVSDSSRRDVGANGPAEIAIDINVLWLVGFLGLWAESDL